MSLGKSLFAQVWTPDVTQRANLANHLEYEIYVKDTVGESVRMGCMGKAKHAVIVKEYLAMDGDNVAYRRIETRCQGSDIPMCKTCGRSYTVWISKGV